MSVAVSTRRHPALITPTLSALAMVGCIAVGFSVVNQPVVATALVFLFIFATVVSVPNGRIAFIVFGGLATLESSQALSAPKLAYLGGAAVVVAIILWRLRSISTATNHRLRPLMLVSVMFMAVLVLSLAVARTTGTSTSAWLRAAAPYLLLATVPLIASDAAASVPSRTLTRFLVFAGILSSASFAVSWMLRRHLAVLPIEKVVLPSGALASALVCYSVSRAYYGRSRPRLWLGVAAFGAGCLLVTGTRTALLVLVAPPVITLAQGVNVSSITRAIRVTAVTLVLTVVAVVTLSLATGASLSHVTTRLLSVGEVGSNGVASQSFDARIAETAAAWHAFRSAPIIGVAPGHVFSWRDSTGELHVAPSVDSPLDYLAEFGLLGLIALVALVKVGIRQLRAPVMMNDAMVARNALIGYASIWLVNLPLGLPFEDKGFSLALILLLAILTCESGVRQGTHQTAIALPSGHVEQL